MIITKLKLREHLEIFGIDEKGKERSTIIAIPPNDGKSRIDIITTKELFNGYNFGCEDDLIIIKVGRFPEEYKILWHPNDTILV